MQFFVVLRIEIEFGLISISTENHVFSTLWHCSECMTKHDKIFFISVMGFQNNILELELNVRFSSILICVCWHFSLHVSLFQGNLTNKAIYTFLKFHMLFMGMFFKSKIESAEVFHVSCVETLSDNPFSSRIETWFVGQHHTTVSHMEDRLMRHHPCLHFLWGKTFPVEWSQNLGS